MTTTDRPPPKGQGLGPVTRAKPTRYPCVVLWVFQPPGSPKTVGFNELKNEAAFASLIEAMDYEVLQTGGELLTFKIVHPALISQSATSVRFCKDDGERGSNELFCGVCGGKTTLVGFKEEKMSTKILIVEDEPAMRQMYMRILNKLPVIVIEADNVDMAKSVFLANPDINVAILDGSPTGASNSTTADLAKEIKQQSPACRLVAVTGRPDLYPELLATCHAVVEKPFEKPELLAALGLS